MVTITELKRTLSALRKQGKLKGTIKAALERHENRKTIQPYREALISASAQCKPIWDLLKSHSRKRTWNGTDCTTRLNTGTRSEPRRCGRWTHEDHYAAVHATLRYSRTSKRHALITLDRLVDREIQRATLAIELPRGYRIVAGEYLATIYCDRLGVEYHVSYDDALHAIEHRDRSLTQARKTLLRHAIRRARYDRKEAKKSALQAEDYRSVSHKFIGVERARRTGACLTGIQQWCKHVGIDLTRIGGVRADVLIEHRGAVPSLRESVERALISLA